MRKHVREAIIVLEIKPEKKILIFGFLYFVFSFSFVQWWGPPVTVNFRVGTQNVYKKWMIKF